MGTAWQNHVDELTAGAQAAFGIVHWSGNHWGTVVIDIKQKNISFRDSLGTKEPDDVLQSLLHWLVMKW